MEAYSERISVWTPSGTSSGYNVWTTVIIQEFLQDFLENYDTTFLRTFSMESLEKFLNKSLVDFLKKHLCELVKDFLENLLTESLNEFIKNHLKNSKWIPVKKNPENPSPGEFSEGFPKRIHRRPLKVISGVVFDLPITILQKLLDKFLRNIWRKPRRNF